MKSLLERISEIFEIATPAAVDAIENAENSLGFRFPEDYSEFLRFTNGLEGEYAGNYLVLWNTEELVELNQAYHVNEFVSNTFIFGSNSAEDAFAFDISDNTIVTLPFIGMGHIANKKLADSFKEFLESPINKPMP